MKSVDHEVLQQAVNWLDCGWRIYLVTVAKSWGSSPRPPGSLAVVRDDGVIAGSVSGGCVEDDLAERICSGELAPIHPQMETYGATPYQVHRFGLPCGSVLELIVEPVINSGNLSKILDLITQRNRVLRRLDLRTGAVSLHDAADSPEFNYSGHMLEKVFGPVWQLLIIGAGQPSQYLARMALMLNYRVMICDPRKEYLTDLKLEEIEILTDMPDDAVRTLQPDCRTAILALTHDPKLDDMALLEALESRAFYIGAIGSHSNNAKRRERLASFDLTARQLSRMHGPAGLPIGSRTPAEIAISILAEMTSVRSHMITDARISKCISSQPIIKASLTS